jgi:hypothetical protein
VLPSWRDSARAKLDELEEQIAFAQRAKTLIEHTLECPHPSPDRCPVFVAFIAEHVKALEQRAGAV